MGIMDNEGHDPMGFGNVRSALPMQADPDPHGALKEARAEIARLREQLSHEWPAIEELTKKCEMYRMRWLGSMTTRDAQLIRDENARLRAAVQAVLSNAGAIEGDAMHVRVSRLLIGPLRSAVEQKVDK